jgi:ABC-type sugar transport system substrate-binding protein
MVRNAGPALEALGTYYNADIACEDGDLNDETQTKQVENMIANNVDIMMIDPITPDGSTEALNKAVAANIPIVIYDGYWTEGARKAVTTVTWDQKSTGTLIGQYFVEYVKAHNDGKARVIELTNAVSTHCQERFVGLHEVIDAANADGCEIEILNKYDSQGNREIAYNAIAAVVEPYDYIISDVDNGAQGAVAALQAAGNTDVKVFSMGAYGEEPFSMLHDQDVNYAACLNVDAWCWPSSSSTVRSIIWRVRKSRPRPTSICSSSTAATLRTSGALTEFEAGGIRA